MPCSSGNERAAARFPSVHAVKPPLPALRVNVCATPKHPSACSLQDIGFCNLGHATELLPQLTQLTFGHGYSPQVDLSTLAGGVWASAG